MVSHRLAGHGSAPAPGGWATAPYYPETLDAETLWPVLAPLSSTYPGFEGWYWHKVIPGIVEGRRRIFVIGGTDAPIAIAIAKREHDENKLCTVWVAARARSAGLGSSLVEEVIEWLGHPKPLLTVPAERYGEFLPLVRRFGFIETARMPSLYRSGVVEHVFNGSATTFRTS